MTARIDHNTSTPAPSNPQETLTKTGHFINGACSSLVMITCLHPVSTIKTYLMNGRGFPSIRNLPKGISLSMGSIVPIQSVSFFTQGALVNHYFGGRRENMTDMQKLAVGLAAGISASPLAVIFDRIIIQMQLNGGGFSSNLYKIVDRCGPLGLIKGYVPTLLREISFPMTLFGLSEIFADRIKNQLPQDWEKRDAFSALMGRVCAGMLGGALTTPIDVVKTRMQADLEGKYPSALKTVSRLVQEEGKKSLTKGIWIRTGFIGLAITVLGYAKEKIPLLFPESLFISNGSKS